MSQHIFETVHNGHAITILMGWDRPLQYFFLVIEGPDEAFPDVHPDPKEPGYAYSNWYEPDPFGNSLEHYRQVLVRYGVSVPDRMFMEVRQDCANCVGNRVVRYLADGSCTEQVN
ncbi:hypothetical protein JQN63_14225 [Delftia lacustris]|uniref:hypothetical protein n=1 Tax=Delftia lacustris TaxID=558537 RepID=UPI00193C801E|nr:hypothetical protein [Delftia lacustris]QRI92964.1 hypothetical protein JQN63_14225 [Delftia lacustris]